MISILNILALFAGAFFIAFIVSLWKFIKAMMDDECTKLDLMMWMFFVLLFYVLYWTAYRSITLINFLL